MSNELTNNLQDSSGQVFMEFLFLLIVIMGLSLFLIKGFNGGLAERWKALVTVISYPSDTPVEVR